MAASVADPFPFHFSVPDPCQLKVQYFLVLFLSFYLKRAAFLTPLFSRFFIFLFVSLNIYPFVGFLSVAVLWTDYLFYLMLKESRIKVPLLVVRPLRGGGAGG